MGDRRGPGKSQGAETDEAPLPPGKVPEAVRLLPPGTRPGELRALVDSMADALRRLGVALVVDADAVQRFEPGVAMCRALGADPWGTLASGCLLVAAAPTAAPRLEAALRRRGYPVATIARAETGSGVRLAGGSPLPRFERNEVARILAG